MLSCALSQLGAAGIQGIRGSEAELPPDLARGWPQGLCGYWGSLNTPCFNQGCLHLSHCVYFTWTPQIFHCQHGFATEEKEFFNPGSWMLMGLEEETVNVPCCNSEGFWGRICVFWCFNIDSEIVNPEIFVLFCCLWESFMAGRFLGWIIRFYPF